MLLKESMQWTKKIYVYIIKSSLVYTIAAKNENMLGVVSVTQTLWKGQNPC